MDDPGNSSNFGDPGAPGDLGEHDAPGSADFEAPTAKETDGRDLDPPPPLPTLDDLLACLRARAAACEPPVGIGSFDVLYASGREVVVWYSPARPEHHPGEVAIPTARLAAAWSALIHGEALDEAALARIGEGAALGRWLLAVLAQLPGVRVREEPSLALEWSPSPPPEVASESPPEPDATPVNLRARRAAGPPARRPPG